MVPVKWKIYLVVNYVLFAIAAILFLVVCVAAFGGNVVEREPAPYLVALGLLALVVQCIMNLYIYSKNFPTKILLGKMLTIHIIATVLNSIGLAGLTLICIVGAYFEFGEDLNAQDQSGKLLLAFLLGLWLIIAFIFFCQLTLARYLRKNSVDLFNTLIDSIGSEGSEPS